MSHRDLGVVILKLVGIVYILYAVGDAVEIRKAFLWQIEIPEIENNVPLQIAVLTFLADVVVAVFLLTQADRLANWLFSERTLSFPSDPFHLLLIGMALIGVWIMANDLALLFNQSVDFLWWSGAERRLHHAEERSEAVLSGIKSALFVGVGYVLYRYATSKLSMLEASSVASTEYDSPTA